MHLDPDYIQVEVGDEFEVDILISDVSDLYGIELTLEFDPVILQVVDIDTSRSGIQMALGDFPYPDFVALNEVDNLYGRVSYGCSQVGQAPVSGSGTTLTVRFEATKAGATALTIQDVLAANQNAIELPTEVSSGEVLVVESDDPPAPPTDPPNETIPAVPTTQAPTRTPLPTHTSPSYLPSATPNAGYPGATPPPTAAPAPTTNTGGYPAPTAAPPPGPATARPSATSMPTNTVVLAPTRQGETPAGGGPSPTVAASVATAVATSDAVSESPATPAGGIPYEAPAMSTDTADAAGTPPPGTTVKAGETPMTEVPPPTEDAVAALVAQPTDQVRRDAERSERPLFSPDLFICFSAGLVLFTALLIIYLTQRGRGRSRSALP